MRQLNYDTTREVQFDEKWNYVGKKEKNCDPDDPRDDDGVRHSIGEIVRHSGTPRLATDPHG
jgi:hypothetical protein